MAFFQDNLSKPASERLIILDFNETREDVVAVASAGPHANHLNFARDTQPRQHLITKFLQVRCSS